MKKVYIVKKEKCWVDSDNNQLLYPKDIVGIFTSEDKAEKFVKNWLKSIGVEIDNGSVFNRRFDPVDPDTIWFQVLITWSYLDREEVEW